MSLPAVPPARTFLTARWQSLVLMSWQVDPDLLHRLLPAGVSLDLFEDRAWLSAVGFRFEGTRVLGVPVPRWGDFPEVNLRYYVKRLEPDPRDGAPFRRGVAFVREIVPHAPVAWAARLLYNEPYVAWPMEQQARLDRTLLVSDDLCDGARMTYRWRPGKSGAWTRVWAEVKGAPEPLPPGSIEQFIAEHYWGYCAQRDGGTVEYQVEHPPWMAWPVADCGIDGEVATTWGLPFAQAIARPPDHCMVAVGSDVEVKLPRRVRFNS